MERWTDSQKSAHVFPSAGQDDIFVADDIFVKKRSFLRSE